MTSMQSSTSLSVSSVTPVGPLLLDDEASFESFYAEHVAFVWRNLKRLGIPCAELEDVCQEVFVTVHRRWTSFEARATPRSWLYGIVRRVAWRHRRGNKRRERRHAAFDVPRRYQTGEPAVASRVLAVRLQQFLEQLDEDKRDVFVLAELEELTAREIAERVGVGPNTVYSRLRAARAAFETKFGPLPRQRDAVKRLHGEDAPSEEQRNRMWLVIVGFPIAPTSSTFKSTATKLAIPGGVAAVVAAVLAWAAAPENVGEGVGVDENVRVDVSVDENVRVEENVRVDQNVRVDESVDVHVDVDVGVGVDVEENALPVKVEGDSSRRRRVGDFGGGAAPVKIEEDVADARESAHPQLARMSRDSAAVVETRPEPVAATPEPQHEPIPEPQVVPKPETPEARKTAATAEPRQPSDSPRIQIARPNRPTPETPDTSGQLDPAELRLLRAARQALDAGNPRRALARVREHARRFEGSSLAPERDATAAEAHCALGHERSARPHLRRLEQIGQARLANTIRERCD